MKTFAAKPDRLCSKKRYGTEEIALAVLAQIHRTSPPGHQECRVYYCSDHKGWHLTSLENPPPHVLQRASR